MSCLEVVQVVNKESVDLQIGAAIGTLFAGLIIGLIIIIIFSCICFRDYWKRCFAHCWACCCCCCCCIFGAGDDDDDEYLLHSWEDAEQETVESSTALASAYDNEQGLVVLNRNFSEFTLNMSDTASDVLLIKNEDYSKSEVMTKGSAPWAITATGSGITEASAFAVTGEVSRGTGHTVITEMRFQTSFYDDDDDAFSSLMWKQHRILYCCEKKDILMFETDFHQYWVDFFLTLLEATSIYLVKEGKVTEKWKNDLQIFCKESLATAQKKHISVVTTRMQDQGKTEEVHVLSLECSINDMLVTVLGNIHTRLNEAGVSSAEAKILVSKLKADLKLLERSLFDLYLQEADNLRNRIHFRECLMNKFAADIDEFIDLMDSHQKDHVKELSKIEMGSTTLDISPEFGMLAAEVENIWTSVKKNFEKELSGQRTNLKEFSKNSLEESDARGKFDTAIHAQKKSFLNSKPAKEYIKFYCKSIKQLLESEARSNTIEINSLSTELNAIIETLGDKFVKNGIKEESALYSSTPKNIKTAKFEADLDKLQTQLQIIRKRQGSDLHSLIGSRQQQIPVERSYFSEVIIEVDSIQMILDNQMDLSEDERQVLADIIAVEMKRYQLHLELCKLAQETRIKSEFACKKVMLSSALTQGKMAVFSNIQTMSQLKCEEQNLEATHQQQIEQTKRILSECAISAKNNIEVLFQFERDKIQSLAFYEDQEVLSTLKFEEQNLLQEHKVNINILDDKLQRSKKHQDQVLQQKIQARKLKKFEEGNQQSVNGSRFVANSWVRLLLEVRHKQDVKDLEEFHAFEGERIKMRLKKCYETDTKHSVKLHKKELIMKLAAALKMSPKDLAKELSTIPSAKDQQY